MNMEGDNKKMYESTSDVTMQPEPLSFHIPQKDYLVWSIINLLFFCLPLGVAALFYSIKTRDANYQNNAVLALKHSGTAYGLNISATVVGIILIIIIIIIRCSSAT
ncbi:dispanin subfamily A member 2b-like [Ranitomeya imitator]|uniref:dispanin subfamily A member 2b-like n=1 Tax=Ranitomeya imitator TaxID=111125 RepID=UPI0037E70A9C